MVKVLGLDLSGRTGFAHGVPDAERLTPPTTGLWVLPSIDSDETVGKAFSALRRNLDALHAKEDFDVVIYEAAFDTYAYGDQNRKKRIVTPPGVARALIGLTCIAEEWAETASENRVRTGGKPIEVLDCHVVTVRGFFLGHGRPANAKAEVKARCAQLGWDIGNDDNRADAAAVWAFECKARDQAWAIALKQSLRGPWTTR